jgi:lipopolysaccharide exporter
LLPDHAGEAKLVNTKISTVRRIIENLKSPGDSLTQRAISGGFWVFLLRIVQQLFSLGRLFILARILSPTDFGLMGVALLTMATLETFSQTGFQTALIQKREDIESYLDSAWTFLIIRGFALFAILYLIAPYAAAFFGAPAAEPIIQIIGISVLLQAFTNIGVLFFQKELEFNKQFLYQLAGTLADFIVAVSAVLIIQNVWALVFGLIAGNAVRCVMSYVVHPYRPHIALDIAKVKDLFGFGKWVFGSGVLVFLVTQGDDILVGKLVGVTALAFYQMAYLISNMPATEVTHVVSQVMFPVYSKLQQDRSRLKDAYLQTLKLTTFVSFFVTGVIFALAPDFTLLFLGEKWMPMVPAIQVLVFAGLIRSIAATAGSIFIAVGKPEIDTRLQIIRLLVLVICIFPFIAMWGIVGASFAVLLSIFISNIGFSIGALKITQCRVMDFVKAIVLPAVGVISIIVSNFGLMIVMDAGIWRFSVCACITVLEYLIITYLFDNHFNYGIRNLVTANLRTLRGA